MDTENDYFNFNNQYNEQKNINTIADSNSDYQGSQGHTGDTDKEFKEDEHSPYNFYEIIEINVFNQASQNYPSQPISNNENCDTDMYFGEEKQEHDNADNSNIYQMNNQNDENQNLQGKEQPCYCQICLSQTQNDYPDYIESFLNTQGISFYYQQQYIQQPQQQNNFQQFDNSESLIKEENIQQRPVVPQKSLQKQKKAQSVQEKPKNDLNDKIRNRKTIEMKKVANKNEKKPVRIKKPQQRIQFHNQFKIFLTKGIPYIIDQIRQNTTLCNEQKNNFITILQPFKSKIKKEDMYFLINKYNMLSKEEFEDLKMFCLNTNQLLKDAKFNASIRAFLQVKNFISEILDIKDLSFDTFTQATTQINQLNSLNRMYLNQFINYDYYPRIFKTKADKIDQLFLINYLKYALRNPKIME